MSRIQRTAGGSFRGDMKDVVERLGGELPEKTATRRDDATKTSEAERHESNGRSLFGAAWRRARR